MLRPPAALLALLLLAACAAQPVAVAPPTAAVPPAPLTAAPSPTPATTPAPPAPAAPTPAATAARAPSAEPAPAEAPPAPTAAPAPVPPLARTLLLQSPRMEGDDVRLVQARLLALGYAQLGAADGVYGPDTEAAVRAFQADSGLAVDGVVGPQTWGRLEAAAGPRVAPLVHAPTGFLFGGARDGAWLAPGDVAPAFPPGLALRRFSASGETGISVAGAPVSAGVPCDPMLQAPLSPPAQPGDVVALGGAWDPLPRAAAPVDAGPYREPVAALLRAAGIVAPDVRLRQALRVDLAGDGAEETLVVASRLAEQRTTIAAGDYSLVALVRDDGSVEKVVGESYAEAAEFGASAEYAVAAVLDLNGDGALEIVVEWSYYEGAGALVFDTSGGQVREALAVGCGV